MKKIFILSLLIIFALSFTSFADAAATKARTASVAQGLQGVYGIGDLSSGNTAEVDGDGNLAVAVSGISADLDVDSDGALATREVGRKLVSFLSEDGAAYSGPAIVYGFAAAGTTAGDYIGLYDATSITGTAVLDIVVGANGTSYINIPGGISFATDVYVDVSSATVRAMTIYSAL